MKHQWYYRGSLNFCNYSCSYCPFSKKTYSRRTLFKDAAEWNRFVSELSEDASYEGAVMVVPYAEALLYDYYWVGLARLSGLPYIDYVGAQSNLSFSVEEKLSVYAKAGGRMEKLRLWLTYHPQMVSMEKFIGKCQKLLENQISFSVGCVGIPGEEARIFKFRQLLPKECYLWINKMDGASRPYTSEEIEAFSKVDPFFSLGLRTYPGKGHCYGGYTALRVYGERERVESCFVDARGRVTGCNLCHTGGFSLYERERGTFPEQNGCHVKNCNCYLSYNNLHLGELVFFEPYPMFRIPDFKKALFFDIDGTLLFPGETQLRGQVQKQLIYLAGHTRLYLATSLPVEVAKRVLKDVWGLFSGGVFGNGGCILTTDGFARIRGLDEALLDRIRSYARSRGFSFFRYQWKGIPYKATMFTKRRHAGLEKIQNELSLPEGCRLLIEGDCIQVTGALTGKKQGIFFLLEHLGLKKEEVMFFGDSDNDEETMRALPFSYKVIQKQPEETYE